MPHDKNGKLLSVGDSVIIPARITEIHNTEDYCNVTLKTSYLMPPDMTQNTIVLNAKQVELKSK